jgi:cation transport ATPase
VQNLTVGKNAVFYDRQGREWDATVYKIIDNPISIRQAFWTPYRKFGNWVTELINKRAAEKEQKQFENITTKVDEKSQQMPTAETAQESPEKKQLMKSSAQAFDIAKFAGIFAAFGMAIGAIGTMLVSIAKGWVVLTWWQQILVILGLLLLISGPSMLIAFLKLRRRNLAPLLNANGWAVNADAIINVLFGATLTDQAKYPVLKLKDPFVKEGMPAWQKWLIAALVVIVLAVGAWLLYKFAYAA